ncbi:class I SAM-dependent methyltransferase [Nocardia sp. NBC_01730]|uniref:class I SAM-dependent methyltransferase n=1 Tax=Nocardia sp. NBC_01730 TaxID=2975998 RepID=UPI002E133B19|nr:class I SAM-dependent methyltransferase [Nocardia sp. NBC_01730]
MTAGWTGRAAIERWSQIPHDVLDEMEPAGDFDKRHLLNPVLLEMLGDVAGRRILDAGCGHGYSSRMLAARGADVTAVEPAAGLFAYALHKEQELRQGITYVEADLTQTLDFGAPFDAVVCSMVLSAIPDWRSTMRTCVRSAQLGGIIVIAINHPAFEQLRGTWREHGEYRVRRYLDEYEIAGRYAPDFHRPLSAYLNELAAPGCRLREVAEPGLNVAVASKAALAAPGIDGYVHLPNFLVISAESPAIAPGRPSSSDKGGR